MPVYRSIRTYAGIGSRDITPEERSLIVSWAAYLQCLGWTLVSGNAEGSDQAFQEGSRGDCFVMLPWKGYNSPPVCRQAFICGDTNDGAFFTKHYHPKPDTLSKGGRALMGRNAHQIIGYEDCPKVSFVLCCATPRGGTDHVMGGTGQAVRIALRLNVPVFNLRRTADHPRLMQFLQERQLCSSSQSSASPTSASPPSWTPCGTGPASG